MKKSIETIGTIGTIGTIATMAVIAIGSFYLGTTQAETITEVQTVTRISA